MSTGPIALGSGAHASTSLLKQGVNALAAPVTPQKRAIEVDLNKTDPKIREAAEGVEAMFVDLMMQAMRDTVPKSDLSLDNSATEIYRSMLDSETAKMAARNQKLGIAEAVVAYLEAQGYNQRQGRVQSAGTGGTSNEGQSVQSTTSSE